MNHKRVIINMSDICTFYIVMIPLIMFYRFPFLGDISCVTVFSLLLSPVLMLKIMEDIFIHKNKAYGLSPLFLCSYCWVLFKCLGLPVHFVTMVAAYICIVAISVSDIYNINLAVKIIENVSIAATIVVLLQFILHHVVGMSYTTLFIYDFVTQYLQHKIDAGWQSGFFRPSAFFSEPSYFGQYAIIGLNSLLFLKSENKTNLKKAIFITIGILITTSGIGLVLSAFVWLLWYSVRRSTGRPVLINVFSGLTVVSLVYFIGIHFSFFSNATQRIFGKVNGYNAISGRLSGWDIYFSNLSIHDWIFGFGYGALPHMWFPGFMELIYATGIIGLVLHVVVIINCMRRTKGFYFNLCLIYLVLLYVANLISFLYTIFWLSLIYFGYKQAEEANKFSVFRISK